MLRHSFVLKRRLSGLKEEKVYKLSLTRFLNDVGVYWDTGTISHFDYRIVKFEAFFYLKVFFTFELQIRYFFYKK